MVTKICPCCQWHYGEETDSTTCPFDGTLLVPVVEDQLVGTLIDNRFRVLKRSVSGCCADIYLAHDAERDEPVALKIMRREYIRDTEAVVRFQREAYVLSCLSIDSIIKLHKYGILPSGAQYLAMEYIVGGSLAHLIQQGVRFTLVDILNISMQACTALSQVHKFGVVHRDVKPSNILINGGGRMPRTVKIIDFGLAHLMAAPPGLTKIGEMLGSPGYMSPEQCRGFRLDGRSDMYALGCVMYELLTGDAPFGGHNGLDTMLQQVCVLPKPFDQTQRGKFVPQTVRDVVLKCLNKDPMLRYSSMDQLHEALDAALLESLGGKPDGKPDKLPSLYNKATNFVGSQIYQSGMFFVELVKVLKGKPA